MTLDDRELRAVQSVLAGRALLLRAVAVLGAHGVVPAVLKGVLVSALAERWAAPPRRMNDVDILVAPRERTRAEHALIGAGLVEIARTRTATTLRDHDLRIDLDVHAHLVEPELYRFDTDDLLRRSTLDRALFGAEVRVLDPHDTYAHLVAHFARGRGNACDARRLGDLATVSRAYALGAAPVAAVLTGHGLARAARYALGLAARRGDRFAGEVVRALPPDPLGHLIVRGAESWLERFPGASVWAAPVPHLLNEDLPAGVRSLTMHALAGARSRARRVLERRAERG
jgi:hypothetical protein